MYRMIGKIGSFNEIQWDKPMIITGGIDRSRAWFFRIPGVFKKDNGDFRFIDDYGTSTHFNNNDSISLSILEKA